MASAAATELSHLLPSLSRSPRISRLAPPHPENSHRTLVSFSSSIRAPTGDLVCTRNGRGPVVVAAGTKHLMGSLTKTEGMRFAVVVSRFNEVVTSLLLEGALETFRRYSVTEENITVVKVPGSFEIPVVAQQLGRSGDFHAVLCIGAVIRGDTTHYDAVANSAASGVLSAGLNSGLVALFLSPKEIHHLKDVGNQNASSGVPCIFGVLTCDDMDQAINRAGGKSGNKGAEAALTAIEMASLFRDHLK